MVTDLVAAQDVRFPEPVCVVGVLDWSIGNWQF